MIYKEIKDAAESKHCAALARDGIDIFTLAGHQVRGAILNATSLVSQMRANHELGILETLSLGYAYIAALLSSMQIKGKDKLSLSLDCEGPLRGFVVDVNASGQVRGYLKVDKLPLSEPVENFDLHPYIGKGSLTLSRFYEGAHEAVSGTTALVHGDLARDLTLFYKESEQIHTAIALSLRFDKAGRIHGAGGIMLQALPGASEEILLDLDDWLPTLPSLGKALGDGLTGTAYLHAHFRAFEPEILGTRNAEFFCSCTRESFAAYLRSLEKKQLVELINEGTMPLEVLCHNCGTLYAFHEVDLVGAL